MMAVKAWHRRWGDYDADGHEYFGGGIRYLNDIDIFGSIQGLGYAISAPFCDATLPAGTIMATRRTSPTRFAYDITILLADLIPFFDYADSVDKSAACRESIRPLLVT